MRKPRLAWFAIRQDEYKHL